MNTILKLAQYLSSFLFKYQQKLQKKINDTKRIR